MGKMLRIYGGIQKAGNLATSGNLGSNRSLKSCSFLPYFKLFTAHLKPVKSGLVG
jgi:hypothetical protein